MKHGSENRSNTLKEYTAEIHRKKHPTVKIWINFFFAEFLSLLQNSIDYNKNVANKKINPQIIKINKTFLELLTWSMLAIL